MTATVQIARSAPKTADAVGVPVGTSGAVPRSLGLSRAVLASYGFEGKVGQTLVVPSASGPTHIAVGIGPGPFTGLRVGVVTALVLGSALQVPVHGVCSLDALAEALAGRHDGDLLVATDARRTEVYWARYAAAEGHATRVTDPAVTKPADLPPDARTLPCAGRGPLLYPDILVNAVAPQDVSAGVLAALAASEIHRGVRTEPVPMYLRRPDAQEPAAPKPALPTSGRP